MSKRAVLYARVSTDEQADKGYSLPTQLEAMRKYVETHDYTIAAELQDDCSGSIRMSDRPRGGVMLIMLDRKEADAVIVYTSDRLSRNLAHSLILREGWQRAGVELHYVNRGKSEDTAEGRLTENIEGVIAEYEREKIRERTMRGMHAKAQSGRWVGNGHTPYGYRREGQKHAVKLMIAEHEAAVVLRIFAMYLGRNGYRAVSMMEIARILTTEGVPSPSRGKQGAGWWFETVRKILTRRTYIGEFTWAEHTTLANELAIIDVATFDEAQKRLQRNKELAKRNKRADYLLSGHFRCECGQVMSGFTDNRKTYFYYRCRAVYGNKHLTHCTQKNVRADVVDALVWQWLTGLLRDTDKLRKGLREMRERRESDLAPKRQRMESINGLMSKAERAINNLASAIARAEDDTSASALESQMKAVSRERAAVISERDMLLREIASTELSDDDENAIVAWSETIQARLSQNRTCAEKRELLDLLDLRIILRHNANGRELFVTCGLKFEGETLPIETRFAASASDTSRNGRSASGRASGAVRPMRLASCARSSCSRERNRCDASSSTDPRAVPPRRTMVRCQCDSRRARAPAPARGRLRLASPCRARPRQR